MSSSLPENCPQWLETLEEGGLGWAEARLFRSATVHPKVFQRPAIPKIDNNFLSASICVSCHHNGLQGLMLWALCQLFLGCRETPPLHGHEHMEMCFVHPDINLDVNINDMNILVSSRSSSRCMAGPCMSPCYIPSSIPGYTLLCCTTGITNPFLYTLLYNIIP